MNFNFPWDTVVKNQRSFNVLANNTYILTIILIVVAFVITFVTANYLIKYQPNNSDIVRRKIFAAAVGLAGISFILLYNWIAVSPYIKVPLLTSKFISIADFGVVWQCFFLFALVYFGLLFGAAKAFRNQPINTLFAKNPR